MMKYMGLGRICSSYGTFSHSLVAFGLQRHRSPGVLWEGRGEGGEEVVSVLILEEWLRCSQCHCVGGSVCDKAPLVLTQGTNN